MQSRTSSTTRSFELLSRTQFPKAANLPQGYTTTRCQKRESTHQWSSSILAFSCAADRSKCSTFSAFCNDFTFSSSSKMYVSEAFTLQNIVSCPMLYCGASKRPAKRMICARKHTQMGNTTMWSKHTLPAHVKHSLLHSLGDFRLSRKTEIKSQENRLARIRGARGHPSPETYLSESGPSLEPCVASG